MPLTREQEAELARRIQAGDTDARNELVEANLGFAYQEAGRWNGDRDDEEYDDTASAAVDGLIEAADRFQPDRGVKFITYAVHWIRQRLHRHRFDDRTVSLPSDAGGVLRRLHKVCGDDWTSLSDDDLAALTGLSPRGIRVARSSRQGIASLDVTVPGLDHVTRMERLQGETPAPDDAAFESIERDLLLDALATLRDRERVVIEYYFGLGRVDAKDRRTLEEIGRLRGVTRERIRQLKNDGLASLKRVLDRAASGHPPPPRDRAEESLPLALAPRPRVPPNGMLHETSPKRRRSLRPQERQSGPWFESYMAGRPEWLEGPEDLWPVLAWMEGQAVEAIEAALAAAGTSDKQSDAILTAYGVGRPKIGCRQQAIRAGIQPSSMYTRKNAGLAKLHRHLVDTAGSG